MATPGASSSTSPSPTATPSQNTNASPSNTQTPEHSPTTIAVVKGLAWLFGSGSKTSTAIRETRTAYDLCAKRDNEESKFIHEVCRLSPTYQTWFQIANLHVWMVRTRYRALPAPYGKAFEQEFVNHFFLDIEDRMRAALNHKAPERIVKGYLTEMRDQWMGATFSFDLGLVGSDAELSGAIWRNLFASRGLDGKGELIGKPGKIGESRAVADGSDGDAVDTPASSPSAAPIGSLSEAALAELPFHLYVFSAYIRRELKRLESISDEDVMAGKIGSFGGFDSHVLAAERDFAMEKEERHLLGLVEDVPAKSSIPKVKRRAAA